MAAALSKGKATLVKASQNLMLTRAHGPQLESYFSTQFAVQRSIHGVLQPSNLYAGSAQPCPRRITSMGLKPTIHAFDGSCPGCGILQCIVKIAVPGHDLLACACICRPLNSVRVIARPGLSSGLATCTNNMMEYLLHVKVCTCMA